MTIAFWARALVALMLFSSAAAAQVSGGESRVQVYDDRVSLAVEKRPLGLKELFATADWPASSSYRDCAAYVGAGMPPLDRGAPREILQCQIHAVVRLASPVPVNRELSGLCWDMEKLSGALMIGTFPSALNPRLNTSPTRRIRAASGLPARDLAREVFPGCRGFLYRASDWVWEFVLLAIADWNGDGTPDYLLELREYSIQGSYDAAQLLVALSEDDETWAAVPPCRLASGEGLPDGAPYAEFCRK